MALQSYALTTLALAKQYIGGTAQTTTTDDSLIEDMINAASRLLIIYTGREFRSISGSQTRSFQIDLSGMVDFSPFELRQVTQIRANTETTTPTTMATTDYQLYPVDISEGGGYRSMKLLGTYIQPYPTFLGGAGAGEPLGLVSARPVVEVSGAWAWADVPAEVDMACRVQVKQWYDRDRQARSQVVAADDSGAPSFVPAIGLSPGVKRMVAHLRVPVVA